MSEALNEFSTRVINAAKSLNVTPDELLAKLEGMGITGPSTELLDDEDAFKFGDFREVLKDKGIALIRVAFKHLKGGKKTEGEQTSTDSRINELRGLGLKVRIEDADPATLLRYYLPDKPSDPITTALKKRFGNKPVIAFRDDGAVAITETLQYLADLEQNYPERTAIMVDGKLAELWPIGAKPNTMVDEDPLFPGQPLRNGYSIVNHRNWSDIPQEKRQMCRIIVERGDIDPNNRDAVLRLLERARADKGLSEAYPEAELAFRQKQKKDDLPKLKVELGSSTTKPNNPFGVPRRY